MVNVPHILLNDNLLQEGSSSFSLDEDDVLQNTPTTSYTSIIELPKLHYFCLIAVLLRGFHVCMPTPNTTSRWSRPSINFKWTCAWKNVWIWHDFQVCHVQISLDFIMGSCPDKSITNWKYFKLKMCLLQLTSKYHSSA